MNILGQPFAPWVTKQIEVRQQSLGYVDYNTDDLLYQNVKAPWIRMASSVDFKSVEDLPVQDKSDGVLEKFSKLGVPTNAMVGRAAARNFILQGGAVGIDDNGNVITYQGLNITTPPVSQFYNGAYGWGETTERGFVPLPGIIDANLMYYSNGALSKATVNMKCFSRNQLALMDALYMRPGYNLLLEFGWSTWLSNVTRKVETFNQFQSPALAFFLSENQNGEGGNPSNFEIPRLIQAEREKTYGNYEGVFGKITNFNWTFNPDGSYSCQTQLTGMGGVIEALKISGAKYTKEEKAVVEASIAAQEAAAEAIEDDVKAKEALNKALNALRLKTELDSKLDLYYENFKNSTSFNADEKIQYGVVDGSIKQFPDPNDNFKKKDLTIKKAFIGFDGVETTSEDNLSPEMYISFGFFLGVVQQNFLLYNKKGTPYFSFDVDFFDIEKDDNYILNLPGQFSASPQMVFTPYTNVVGGSGYEKVDVPDTNLNVIFKDVKNNFIVDKSQYLGRLAYVYLNYSFIKKCLLEARRDPLDNSLAMLPFLKTILVSISRARGGLNNIVIHEDINTNKIKFIEEVPQNWKDKIPPKSTASEFCKINTYGVKNKVEGSIVRNIDMNGTISKDFASMISIGAQSNGNQLNENATAFSKYNKGLIDRTFKEKVTTKKSADSTLTPKETEVEDLNSIWTENMNKATDNTKGLFDSVMNELKWIDENVGAFESANTTFIKLLQGMLVEENVVNPPFFLPFNLSLDVDGISGIKLYEKFTIDDNVLPPSYDQDSVDLQISAANHTVSAKDWITKIETQSVPKSPDKVVKEVKPMTEKKDVSKTFGSTSSPGGDLPPPPGEQPPEDELLRLRLTRIMDDGTQTLGVMEILAEDETTVLYSLPTSELPWKGNENRVSCIPTDNYRVKSHVSGKHGRCFWLIGNEQGGYAFNKLFGNGYTRTAVLIHMFPKAPGWALGCIGPGLKFNTSGDQKGRQQGTGTKYLNPAKAESYKAMDKLTASLYSVGSFKMKIVNQGGVSSTSLPSTFNESVKALARAKNVL